MSWSTTLARRLAASGAAACCCWEAHASSSQGAADAAAAPKLPSAKAATACSSAPAAPKSNNELMHALAHRHRTIFLSGPINDESAKTIVAQLLFVDAEAPGKPVHLLISSSGGRVQAGTAIHDVMRSLRSPVHTTCIGHCESMAAVILAAGERGERRAMPNARIMVHQPTRSPGGASKTSKQLLISATETEKSRLKLAALLARDTGRSEAEMAELLEHDQYYSPDEARAAGIIDEVVGDEWAGVSPAAPQASTAGEPAVDATAQSAPVAPAEKAATI